VVQYCPPSRIKAARLKKKYGYVKDDAWVRCWKPIQNGDNPIYPEHRDCYKATLIIPMTLWGQKARLSPRFLEMLQLKKDDKPGRFIFGFLCFDHTDRGFFNDDTDVMMGYIAADLLSLYIIIRLNYTVNSKTFRDALAACPEIEYTGTTDVPKKIPAFQGGILE
jgi:hypothetical protein